MIEATTEKFGPEVRAALDEGEYPQELKVTEAEFAGLEIKSDRFHGEWNHKLLPRIQTRNGIWQDSLGLDASQEVNEYFGGDQKPSGHN